MFKVLKVDGPNIMTDLGGVSIHSFSYADGGKSQPVSQDDWRKMRDLFLLLPQFMQLCDKYVRAAEMSQSSCGFEDNLSETGANALAMMLDAACDTVGTNKFKLPE